MIELKNMTKEYKNQFLALKECTISFRSNSLNVLVGKSGSGKTTLLNIIGGLDMPSSGQLYVYGKEINKKSVDAYRNTEVGFVFQDMNLIPSLSLKENLNLAFDLCGKKMNNEDIESVLKAVSLPDGEESIKELLKKKPYQLSQGQMQRFTIARALIKKPSILLLDEPTSALDEENATNILQLLKELAKTKTVIISSHDKNLFVDAADQVVEMSFGKAAVIKPYADDKLEETRIARVDKKGFFSFIETLKIALMNLKNKKIRLVTSIIVAIVASSLFGVASLFNNCNTTSVLLNTQIDNNQLGAVISKQYEYRSHADYSLQTTSSPFSEEEIEKISNHTNGNYAPLYGRFNFLMDAVAIEEGTIITTYMRSGLSDFAVEVNPSTGESVLGLTRYSGLLEETACHLPENYNEIAISSIQAALFMKYGINTLDGEGEETTYYPEKIDDLIGYTFTPESKYLNDGQTLTICGIYSSDDGMSDFWIPLLELSDTEIEMREDYAYLHYRRNSYSIAQCFYVKEGFYQNSNDVYENTSRYYVKLRGDYAADYQFLTSFDHDSYYINYFNGYTGFTSIVSTVTSDTFALVLYVAIAILLLISFATSIGLFYGNIKSMERDLGIYRAMGASKMAISLIILLQALAISLFEYLITLIGLAIFTAVINQQVFISLLSINIATLGFLFLLLVVFALIVSILSSRKALMQKPINIIKEK